MDKQPTKGNIIETINQMQKRHDTEINKLQTNCTHPKLSEWLTEYWAIAHGTGFEIKVCKTCGKTIRKRTHCWKCKKLTENPHNGIGTSSRPFGSWYCNKCTERTPQEIDSDNKEQKQTSDFFKAMESKPRNQQR